jgi:hypothetical protein
MSTELMPAARVDAASGTGSQRRAVGLQPSRLALELPWRSGSGVLFGALGDCSTKTSPLQKSTEQELRPVSRMRRHRSAKF